MKKLQAKENKGKYKYYQNEKSKSLDKCQNDKNKSKNDATIDKILEKFFKFKYSKGVSEQWKKLSAGLYGTMRKIRRNINKIVRARNKILTILK
mmetsp:Transcript_29515/g.26099  ORF Transcript_29515/g.26099 Transcript_29515/m.26099 type:complete len:94 (+) Transcript_29515:469-750(+)